MLSLFKRPNKTLLDSITLSNNFSSSSILTLSFVSLSHLKFLCLVPILLFVQHSILLFLKSHSQISQDSRSPPKKSKIESSSTTFLLVLFLFFIFAILLKLSVVVFCCFRSYHFLLFVQFSFIRNLEVSLTRLCLCLMTSRRTLSWWLKDLARF